jgi:CxxC motif-containing protein
MKKEMICISCPIGCHLIVDVVSADSITVTGNLCNRGEAYGKEECVAPKRVVTAVVKTNSSRNPYVPVKIDQPILKQEIFQLLKFLYSLSIPVPIRRGDVLVENYNNTGIRVVATRSFA